MKTLMENKHSAPPPQEPRLTEAEAAELEAAKLRVDNAESEAWKVRKRTPSRTLGSGVVVYEKTAEYLAAQLQRADARRALAGLKASLRAAAARRATVPKELR